MESVDNLRGEENVGEVEGGGEEGCDLGDGVARLVVADLADVESHFGMRLGVGDEGLDAGLDLGEAVADGGNGICGGGVTRVERGTGLEPAVFGRLPLGGVAVNHALPFSAPAVDAVGRDAGGLEVAALERVDHFDHLGG